MDTPKGAKSVLKLCLELSLRLALPQCKIESCWKTLNIPKLTLTKPIKTKAIEFQALQPVIERAHDDMAARLLRLQAAGRYACEAAAD